MQRHRFKPLAGATVLIAVLGVGVAAGGGLVSAAAQTGEPPDATAATQAQAEPGILIQGVVPGSPAATAKVARGDILLKVDDQSVNTLRDLQNALKDRKSGDQVRLTVQHGDEQRTLTATVGNADGPSFLGMIPCAGPHAAGLVMRAAPGAIIHQVEADSPASRAGLQQGDVITAVDGQKLEARQTLADAIGAHKPGDTVTLEVTRPGQQPREVKVQLGQNPNDAAKAYLGVRTAGFPMMDQLEVGPFPFGASALPGRPDALFEEGGADVQQGAVIRQVTDQGPAATAGLQEGDLITAVDGKPLDDPQALPNAVAGRKPGDPLKLTVHRSGQADAREVEVKLGEHPEKKGTAYLGAEVGYFVNVRRPKDAQDGDPANDLLIPAPDFHFELDQETSGGPEHLEFRMAPGSSDPSGSGGPGGSGQPTEPREPGQLGPTV